MVTNNVTVYQFEVGLDEVFADEVRFRVNVDCVIVVVVKDCLSKCLCGQLRYHWHTEAESRCSIAGNGRSATKKVSYDIAGTLKQKVGVALPATAAQPPKRRFDE